MSLHFKANSHGKNKEIRGVKLDFIQIIINDDIDEVVKTSDGFLLSIVT